MGKPKKELLASAPWRLDPKEQEAKKFKGERLKVTNQPGSTPTMHVPGKKRYQNSADDYDNDGSLEIDPELRYSFQRNIQKMETGDREEAASSYATASGIFEEKKNEEVNLKVEDFEALGIGGESE